MRTAQENREGQLEQQAWPWRPRAGTEGQQEGHRLKFKFMENSRSTEEGLEEVSTEQGTKQLPSRGQGEGLTAPGT